LIEKCYLAILLQLSPTVLVIVVHNRNNLNNRYYQVLMLGEHHNKYGWILAFSTLY